MYIEIFKFTQWVHLCQHTFMGSITCFARISLTLILTSQYLRHHVQIHFHLYTHIYTQIHTHIVIYPDIVEFFFSFSFSFSFYIFVEFWIFLYLKCSLLSLKWLLVFIVFPYFPRNTKTQGSGWVVKIYKPPLRNKDEYSIMNILTHMAPTSHVQPVNK